MLPAPGEQDLVMLRLFIELVLEAGCALTRKDCLLKVGDFFIYLALESKNSPLSKSTTGSSEGVI